MAKTNTTCHSYPTVASCNSPWQRLPYSPGQRYEVEFGLSFYVARWYDGSTAHFISADTIIPQPGNAGDWGRYAYVLWNPMRYTGQEGHWVFPPPPFVNPTAIGGLVLAIAVVADIASTPAITSPRAPQPTSSDMTGWLVDRMNENRNSPEALELKNNFDSLFEPKQIIDGLKSWVGLVRGHAFWDYKEEILESGILIEQKSVYVSLSDQEVNYQAVANINYGFMAGEIGMPQWMAEAGAGAFQIIDHLDNLHENIGGPATWFDDPADNYWIRFGYHLSNQPTLTSSSFSYSLRKYSNKVGCAPEPISPGYYFE